MIFLLFLLLSRRWLVRRLTDVYVNSHHLYVLDAIVRVRLHVVAYIRAASILKIECLVALPKSNAADCRRAVSNIQLQMLPHLTHFARVVVVD